MEDCVSGESTKTKKIGTIPSVVHCTICHSEFDNTEIDELRKHFQLNVLVCKECYELYGTEEFSQDESGNYKYCSWCGNGGKLFLCDFCPHSFCSPCVMFNFGREEVSKMKRERWRCFVCKPERLQPKIALCDRILKQSAEACKDQLSFMHDAFDKSNDSIIKFKGSLKKLQKIEMYKSKSLKHVIKKWEDMVDVHKRELKNIMTNLSDQYKVYVNKQQQVADDSFQKTTNYNDSDLQLDKCTVFLKKCDNIIPFGTTTINIPSSYLLKNTSSEVGKLTGLKKTKELPTPKKPTTDDKKQNLEKGKASKRTSSLPEITFSSAEDEIGDKKVDDILEKLNDEQSEESVVQKRSSNFTDILPPFDDENSDSSYDFQHATKRKYEMISKNRIFSDGKEDIRGTSEKENNKNAKKNKKTQSDDEKQASSSSDSEMKVVKKKKKKEVYSSDESEIVKGSPKKGRKSVKKKI